MHNEQHSLTGSNPYKHLRIGLNDHLLNHLPLFNPNWFSQASIIYSDTHVIFQHNVEFTSLPFFL